MHDSAVWSWQACPSKIQLKSSARKICAARRLAGLQPLLASLTDLIILDVEKLQFGDVGQGLCHALSANIPNIIGAEIELP